MKIKGISFLLICVLLLSLLTGCGGEGVHMMNFPLLFDTVGSVTVCGSPGEAAACHQFLSGRLNELHQLFDIYHDYEGMNNLKTVNDRAGQGPVAVREEILDLLQFGQQVHTLTLGKVNIAAGAVFSLWHDARETGVLPANEALTQADLHTDIQKLIIDRQAGTVYLTDGGMRLDVGAVAKGYAVALAAKEAEEAGYGHFLLNMGGNVYAVEDKKGTPWTVGVKDPLQTEGMTETVRVSDRAVVTSGVYHRYTEIEGQQIHHIIDPDTLSPAAEALSATVICGDSALADALSTALVILPCGEAIALAESVEGVEAMVIDLNGQKYYTSGFAAYG